MARHAQCAECGATFKVNSDSRPGRGRYCCRTCHLTAVRRRRVEKCDDTFQERFWARVDQSGGPDACWPWVGRLDKDGYPCVRRRNAYQRAARVALELDGAALAEDLHACHHCDNRACCNPKHLYAGTRSQNMQDRLLPKTMTLLERVELRAREKCPG